MKKVIFIFRHYAGVPPFPGGYQHFNLAKCMLNDGYDVFLFVSNFNHVTKTYIKKLSKYFQVEKVEGINVVWINNIPSYNTNGIKRLIGMIDYSIKVNLAAHTISRGANKARIILGSVAHSFAVVSAWFFSWRKNIPLWVDISELWPEAYMNAGVLSKSNPLVYLLGALANLIYKKGNIVTVINANSKDFIVKHRGVSKDNVLLFVPGFECGEFPLCNPRKKSNQEKCFTLTYTGSLGDLYPLENLIIAVSKLMKNNFNIEVNLVGDGSKRNSLLALSNKLGTTGVINFSKSIKKEDLWAIYNESDALLVIENNVKFGFPSKLLDYFNAARPVLIASEADYLLPGDLFTKCLPTPTELERALKILMSYDEATMVKKGLDTFAYAKKNYKTSLQYSSFIRPKLNDLISKT